MVKSIFTPRVIRLITVFLWASIVLTQSYTIQTYKTITKNWEEAYNKAQTQLEVQMWALDMQKTALEHCLKINPQG